MELLLVTFFIGFAAQLIDGTLGMAYGIFSTSFLLTFGLTPALASATVHTSEVFTTLASGISHLRLGNVDRRLFRQLVIPGCISAVVGAVLLANLSLWFLKPAISIYLGLMGGVMILRAFGKRMFTRHVNRGALAATGGFFDAVGGGGWGPIVTGTLVANGEDPKKTIGSVNATEFFVTVSQSLTFGALLGFNYLGIVAALTVGGLIAAPLAAYLVRRIPTRMLMIFVGILIVGLQIRHLVI